MVTPPDKYRGKHLVEPFFAHPDEWDKFCEGVTDDFDLAEKVMEHSTPRKKPFSEEQNKMISVFTQAAEAYGYKYVKVNRNLVRATRPRSSDYVEYNPYLDIISCGSRKKAGMFGSIFDRQIMVNVKNKMNEISGKSERDDFDALETIGKITEEAMRMVNDIM